MATTIETKRWQEITDCSEMANLFGRMYAFNNALKLYHWSVTGKGSYAQHMALDQALESLSEVLDRLVETVYALKGDMEIIIPETVVPLNLIKYACDFYKEVEYKRGLFTDKFIDSIIDDYQEAIQQLLYRIVRLE